MKRQRLAPRSPHPERLTFPDPPPCLDVHETAPIRGETVALRDGSAHSLCQSTLARPRWAAPAVRCAHGHRHGARARPRQPGRWRRGGRLRRRRRPVRGRAAPGRGPSCGARRARSRGVRRPRGGRGAGRIERPPRHRALRPLAGDAHAHGGDRGAGRSGRAARRPARDGGPLGRSRRPAHRRPSRGPPVRLRRPRSPLVLAAARAAAGPTPPPPSSPTAGRRAPAARAADATAGGRPATGCPGAGARARALAGVGRAGSRACRGRGRGRSPGPDANRR